MSRPRIKELEELATKMVGDGKKPDVFFVSIEGDITLVTTFFETAYQVWSHYAALIPLTECALENRTFGVIASVEPDSDDDDVLVRHDDSRMFRKEVGL